MSPPEGGPTAGAVGGAEARLRRGLERLRADPARVAVPADGTTRRRAERLADRLGGTLVGDPAAPAVLVESEVLLPLPRDPLARLPVPVDPAAPLLCLDTETTGLGTGAGTVPFLVGTGHWDGERFRVRQLLLPDHPSEPALLDRLADELAGVGTLVTYNGRSFDWPLLVARHRLHGRAAAEPPAHLDLLPFARQVWRHRLPDARLGTVEAGVAGVRRTDDLPGSLVPERWLTWLRDEDPDGLTDVLRHNRQDIVSLALLLRVVASELLPAALDRLPAADAPVAPGDLAGIAGLYARRARPEDALAAADAACERVGLRDRGETATRVTILRARLLGRAGRHAEALGAWEAIALDGGPGAALAWIQVAKDREHRHRDPVGALAAARRAAALAERSAFAGRRDRLVERDLARRLPRLLRLAERARPYRDGDAQAARSDPAGAAAIRSRAARVRSTSSSVL